MDVCGCRVRSQLPSVCVSVRLSVSLCVARGSFETLEVDASAIRL